MLAMSRVTLGCEVLRSRAAEEKELSAATRPGEWNEYGGWRNGPQLEATGHFRVEKYDSYSGNGINNTSSAFKQTVVTPRFGVVILPTRNFSIYGSFAKSNKPNTAFDRFGKVVRDNRITAD